MKKAIAFVLAIAVLFAMCACSQKPISSENSSQVDTTKDTGTSITAPIDTIPLDKGIYLFDDMTDLNLQGCYVKELRPENAGSLMGYQDFSGVFEEAYALTPMMNIDPFVLILFRLGEGQDAKAFAKDIKDNANPARWVCVSAERVEAVTSGHTVLFFMCASDMADPLLACFDSMSQEGFAYQDHLFVPLKDMTATDLHEKLLETFSVESYGFLDNDTLRPVTDKAGYGLAALANDRFIDSLWDEGYAPANEDDPTERAYMLSIFRLEKGVYEKEFAEIMQEVVDASSLRGKDAQTMIAYGEGMVVMVVATGNYGYSAHAMGEHLMTEFRMSLITE